jgi:hypothetical protein
MIRSDMGPLVKTFMGPNIDLKILDGKRWKTSGRIVNDVQEEVEVLRKTFFR